tara:strand:+ start:165 stop:377 length:213 start_codon:yes stop_codon:yes gene_type:complete
MNTQKGDAGVSIMLVMMVAAVIWMFSGGHGGHGMMSSGHDKTDPEGQAMPANKLLSADTEPPVDNEMGQD